MAVDECLRRLDERKILVLTLIFLVFAILPAVGQENQQPSQEELQEFRAQYWSAFQEGNTQKAKQLVRENREQAEIVAKSLFSQGAKAYRMADYETAFPMLMVSKELFRQLGDKQREAIALTNIGSIYRSIGEYQQALSYYQEALNISRGFGDKAGEMTTLNNIGGIYKNTGEYQQALSYYQEALNISREFDNKIGEGIILNNVGEIYHRTGEYQQALDYYQEALNISRELDNKAGEMTALSNIGGIYLNTGEYKQALSYYQKALNISRDLGDKAGEGIILNSIGTVYYGTGGYQQALSYYQEALNISKKIGDKAGEGTLLDNIGRIYQDTGEYQRALSYYQEALNISRKLGDKAGEGATLNGIGRIYHDTGEYQRALNYYQEALDISRKIRNKSGEMVALNNIGGVYDDTGEYQQALNYYQEALNIGKKLGDKAGEGTTLNNIGEIYQSTDEYQQALSYYQDALNISRKIGDKAGEGRSLGNIGRIYQSTGESQRALSYYQEALKIKKELGDKAGEGAILNNIGLTYQDTGEYQKTLSYYHEALKIRQDLGDKAGEGIILNNIGLTYQNIDEYQRALSYYQEALKINKEIGNKAGKGTTLHNIGWIYQDTGEHQRALSHYQEALKIDREIGNKVGEMVSLTSIGYFHEQQEEWIEAITSYKQAIELLENIRSTAGGSESKESFLAQQFNVYPLIVKLLLRFNKLEEAFVYSERSKARSFLEQLYEASTGVKQDIDRQLIEEENKLYDKLSAIEKTLKEKLSDEPRNQLLEERNTLDHELSVLKQKLRSSNPRYAELKYPQPATVDQIQQEVLKERDVLVEYLQGSEELYVFIIGKTKLFAHTLKIEKQELSVKILELLNPIRNASHKELNDERAHEFYQLMVQPLEQKIIEANQGKEVQTLIIVPDGSLFYLPFEMLVTKEGENPEYLVDRYNITYSPSASVLKPDILHAQKPEEYTQDLLALAPFGEEDDATTKIAVRSTENLLLSDTLRSGVEGVHPLPYSAGEVKTISNLYPHTDYRIGADATKSFFKDHAKGNRYLHLSTHGYLDSEQPMFSGLLFPDGMLQTYEIFNMEIDADLTVLSACQTGLGELKAGEGLVGLTRAFMYAGSPSVLVSLWSVSDPSTAAFMKRFYRNLNKGKTKAEALRETKIWMKEKSYHTDEHGNIIKHDQPFYWAPFILVGAWE